MTIYVFVTDDRRNALGKAISGSYDVVIFLPDRSASIVYAPDPACFRTLSEKGCFPRIAREGSMPAFSSDIGETAALDMLGSIFGPLRTEYELLHEADDDADFYTIGMI